MVAGAKELPEVEIDVAQDGRRDPWELVPRARGARTSTAAESVSQL